MGEVTIHFRDIIQDSQGYGSDREHMVSRVFFSIEEEGRVVSDLTVDVKHTVGESYDTASLEVSRPKGYDGSIDYDQFREEVEVYYRESIGPSASAVRFKKSSKERMYQHRVVSQKEVRVRCVGEGSGR